jgi:ribosomal protein S18 acetylase RimI-like enzyme
VEIRTVRREEWGAAGRLVVAAYRALPGAHMSGGYEAELADVERRASDAEVLVGLERAAVVGCVTFVPDWTNSWAEGLEDGEASIRMLAVDPAFQGHGAGAALLDACTVRARSLGRRAIFLHSTPWMTAAHRLYDRAGYVRVPDRDWLPVPDVPLLGFRLDLRE